ncbi:MAG: hypothetical protein OSJ61_04805, partial [Lachnospiraceae bacterium]|nr:hypothetical protein [Lachnospiraceae bacterium]
PILFAIIQVHTYILTNDSIFLSAQPTLSDYPIWTVQKLKNFMFINIINCTFIHYNTLKK